ncbi:MAG: hypothetical protein VB858_00905, partial [Planctomycetaceae bacterium]
GRQREYIERRRSATGPQTLQSFETWNFYLASSVRNAHRSIAVRSDRPLVDSSQRPAAGSEGHPSRSADHTRSAVPSKKTLLLNSGSDGKTPV